MFTISLHCGLINDTREGDIFFKKLRKWKKYWMLVFREKKLIFKKYL